MIKLGFVSQLLRKSNNPYLSRPRAEFSVRRKCICSHISRRFSAGLVDICTSRGNIKAKQIWHELYRTAINSLTAHLCELTLAPTPAEGGFNLSVKKERLRQLHYQGKVKSKTSLSKTGL